MIYDIDPNFNLSKNLRIRFFKIDRFIRIYDRTRYLTLFCAEIYDAIYNRIRYLIYIFSYYCLKIKIDSILNKYKNYYHYRIFLEKCSYQLAKK